MRAIVTVTDVNEPPVLALVEEQPGLLPAAQIDVVLDAGLAHVHRLRDLAAEDLDALVEPLERPRAGIVARKNAARREQAEARRQGRHVGIGVAFLVEKAGLGPWEYARVEVDATGHVVVYSGVASVGQGIETTLAQVCADELNVPPERITVVHGDSARVPFGVVNVVSVLSVNDDPVSCRKRR